MKIYSWNVLRSNKKLPELYEFVENLDFDVLCLQEVTEEMLARFKEMPFHIVYHVDRFAESYRTSSKPKKNIVVNYAVILSKYSIKEEGRIKFPDLLRTFRSNTFETRMQRVQKWESITNLGAVYADLEIDSLPVRVFSVHLALWNPQTREKEFAHLMDYMPRKGIAVICGDFNILEYAPVKILNWLLGGTLGEAMPWYSERTLFEQRFKDHKLRNPLRGMVTHYFSHSQLDHILIPDHIKAKSAWVVRKRYGSDHQPVAVELDLAS